jgi:hypothetical protein
VTTRPGAVTTAPQPSGDTTGATDTTAINDALAAAPLGGSVVLSPGTYRTDAPLLIPPQVMLLGTHSSHIDSTVTCIEPVAAFTRVVSRRRAEQEAEEVVEKLSEPFEDFTFIQKPFDEKRLAEAISVAIDKNKTQALSPTLQELVIRVDQLQLEIDAVKQQLNKLIN